MHSAAAVALAAIAVLLVAYFTYGRFLARRVFQLDPLRRTPSHELKDGIDYVPTPKSILFGHHFAAIAGLGPILGPAIAVIWGWLPAVLWIVFGAIFIGAVHDFGALTLSVRYQGRSVGDICRDLMGPRARVLALLIIFFMMSLAMGSFCNSISDLFVNFNPDAIIPSMGIMVVAIGFGVAVFVFRAPVGVSTAAALLVFGGMIFWGVEQPIASYRWFAKPATVAALDAAAKPAADGKAAFESPFGAEKGLEVLKATGQDAAAADLQHAVQTSQYLWIGVLLAYGFFASVLPVWLLLQPRDYINSFQLYFALAAMVVGLIVAAVSGSEVNQIHAPAVRLDVAGAPSIFPFLFVTVACGAVSGFHSLVSSGTTAKQINSEADALTIGYGSMLIESALAVLVVLACVAGLGAQAWSPGGVYSGWQAIGAGGLGPQLNAAVRGGGAFLNQLGIPANVARTFLAVTVTAFALTTLDSATRLLRYNVEEICNSVGLKFLANRWVGSALAIASIAFFALDRNGKVLWTLFGTTNQLLAGLALLTVSVFLYKLGRNALFTLIPMVAMLGLSSYAMILNLIDFVVQGKYPLAVVSIIVLAMSLWLLVEGLLALSAAKANRRSNGAPPGDNSAGHAARGVLAATNGDVVADSTESPSPVPVA